MNGDGRHFYLARACPIDPPWRAMTHMPALALLHLADCSLSNQQFEDIIVKMLSLLTHFISRQRLGLV